jgi:hypothetical protein
MPSLSYVLEFVFEVTMFQLITSLSILQFYHGKSQDCDCELGYVMTGVQGP